MGKKAVFKLFYFTFIIITLFVAGITIAGGYASQVSPENSKLMATLAFILPALIFTNAIFLIYWIIRFRFWVWIPVIAIACNWNFLTTIYQFSKDGSLQTKEQTLKIATYNVAMFGKHPKGFFGKKIAEYMNDENVDVLCFQEFGHYGDFTLDSINSTFRNWPYYAIPQATEGKQILQIAVYSKYPIIDSQLITYPETPNCSMYCDILVNGTTIRVFNNHLQTTNVTQNRKTFEREIQNTSLDYGAQFALNVGNILLDNEAKRAHQADVISKMVQESPYPVLVCGDFNSTPFTYPYYQIKKSGLLDGFQTAGKGYMYTYRLIKRLLRIDYIFHSPSIQGYNYYSPDWELSSDHNPVIMQVGI